jgi:predicted metalloendopeptidase
LNGKWLDTFQLPADKGTYGSFTVIDDTTQEQLRSIVEGLARPVAAGAADKSAADKFAAPSGASDPDILKLTDLYASFMDEARLEILGMKPLQAEFAAIDAISDKAQIPAVIAHMNRIGAGAPYEFYINQDAKNSTQYAVIVDQSGLGMPDRDYYLKDDAKLKETRAKYLAHVAKMLGMAGDATASGDAAAILELETALAQTHVRLRLAQLCAGHRDCGQGRLRDRFAAQLLRRTRQGHRCDAAAGLEILF